jgi:hypothetical protein
MSAHMLSAQGAAMNARALEAPPAFFQKPEQAKSDAQKFQDREYAAGRLTEVIETDRAGRQIT